MVLLTFVMDKQLICQIFKSQLSEVQKTGIILCHEAFDRKLLNYGKHKRQVRYSIIIREAM